MRRTALMIFVLLLALLPGAAIATQKSKSTASRKSSSTTSSSKQKKPVSTKSSAAKKAPTIKAKTRKTRAVATVQRDKNGKIKHSESAKSAFMKAHPCPTTGKTSGSCHGYVIDHIIPLAKGGKDLPSNMQWQTTAEGQGQG